MNNQELNQRRTFLKSNVALIGLSVGMSANARVQVKGPNQYEIPPEETASVSNAEHVEAVASTAQGGANKELAVEELNKVYSQNANNIGDSRALKQAMNSRPVWLSQEFWSQDRSLWLYRGANGETVKETYFKNGQIDRMGYQRLCTLLRDIRQNQTVAMDFYLLDILRAIQGYYTMKGYSKPIVINSGFRTRKTNESLEGAAKNSMHLYGKAADLYMPGIPLKDLLWFGSYFKSGGVGFYPTKGFIHLDTGHVRFWRG